MMNIVHIIITLYYHLKHGSVVDSYVLGDGSQKVVNSSPGQVILKNYFHFIYVLSNMSLLNNI